MPYTEPELKADKGQKNGHCNRTACQAPGAVCYNKTMQAYYCVPCARLLNERNPDIVPPLCEIPPADEVRRLRVAARLEVRMAERGWEPS